MKKLFFNRKLVMSLVLMMMLLMTTAVVYAANTPGWWDNPGGTYTSWNTSGKVYGVASNSTGSNQTLIVENDVITCNVGDHIEIWMQIAWVNTGAPDVVLRTGSLDRAIVWTNDANGCPATVTAPLPSEDGVAGLTNELAFTPTGNSQPGNSPFDNGYERSHTFADSTATCARTRVVFDIPDGAGFEYRVETQSICYNSPTAVSLHTPTANSTSPLPLLIGIVLLAMASTAVFIHHKT